MATHNLCSAVLKLQCTLHRNKQVIADKIVLPIILKNIALSSYREYCMMQD